MDLKARLKHGLMHARGYTAQVLSEFHRPEEWIKQLAPGTNHALWIAGHLALVDNAFINRIDSSQTRIEDHYPDLFGKGTSPLEDFSAYPEPAEVMEYMQERRSVFLELLENFSEKRFAEPTPPGSPAFMPDFAALFQMAVWHEAIHSGQLSSIHRSLGHPPVAGRPAK